MSETQVLLECKYCGSIRKVTKSYIKWVNPKSFKCQSCGDRNISLKEIERVDFYPEIIKEDKEDV